MTIPTAGSRELRLAALADELRADAATGLHYTTDDADAARFHRLRGLAAALLSHVDTRDAAELEAIFAADSGPRTPLAGVVLLFNHQRDGLLFVADGDTVGVPYAFVEPDNDHDTAVRDLAAKYLPDAGLVPVPHGVCDSISAGLAMPHTYFLTYVVDLTLIDDDAITVDLVPEADTVPGRRDALTNFILDGARRDVLEAPFALTDEVAALVTAVRALATEGGVATENPYDVERFAHIRETTHSLLEGVRNQTGFTPVEFAHLDVATTKTCAEMLILDDRRRILLLRRHDNGKWAMPGGACEVGESSAATASRETTEEVRVDATIDGLAGVFDNSRIEDRPIQLRTCFVYVGHPTVPGAKPETTAEALEVGWFELDGLEDLPELWEPHLVKITAALKTLVE